MEKKMSTGKNIWRFIYPFLINLAVQYAVIFAFEFSKIAEYLNKFTTFDFTSQAEMSKLVEWLEKEVFSSGMLITAIADALLIVVLLIFYFLDKKKWDTENPLSSGSEKSPLPYAMSAFIGVGCCIFFNILLAIIVAFATQVFGEGIMQSYDATEELLKNASLALEIVSAVIIGPIAEELLVRGLVFKRMRSYAGFGISALVSAIAFGIMHGNWVQFLYAVPIGLICAFVFEYTKSLIAPILLHIFANGISTLMSMDLLSPYFNNAMFGIPMTLTVALSAAVIVTGMISVKKFHEQKND